MKFLTRDQILAADDLPHADVEVPEWGGMVRVRTLRGTDRARLQALMPADNERSAEDWVERLVIACTCDETGEALFTAEDVAALGKKNARALQRIFVAADDLNAVSAGAVERIKGESEPSPK